MGEFNITARPRLVALLPRPSSTGSKKGLSLPAGAGGGGGGGGTGTTVDSGDAVTGAAPPVFAIQTAGGTVRRESTTATQSSKKESVKKMH